MRLTLYRISLLLFLSAWISNVSIAQDKEAINQPITKSGSLAMDFGFGGLSSFSMPGEFIDAFLFPSLNLNTTNTQYLFGAGAKYYISNDMAIRAIVGFSSKSSSVDTVAPGQTVGTLVGLSVGLEMHTHPVYAISPYFGGQVSIATGNATFSSQTETGVVKNGISSALATTTNTKFSATGFGIGVMAGFDWYVFTAIAIGCEYGLSFHTSSGSATTNGVTTNSPSSTSFGIGGADIHLLIHL